VVNFLLLLKKHLGSDFVSKIKILNLSRNLLGKEGAKIISTIFVHNNIVNNIKIYLIWFKTLGFLKIEVFDISNNKIGVAGAQAIAHALEKNTSVKVLNIFANTIDVDGARAFEKTLSVNSTLELIDFGHNRLRNEGLMAIAKGIFANKTSAVSHLALRFNFVTEDGFTEFLKKVFKYFFTNKFSRSHLMKLSLLSQVLNNPKVALKEIYLKNNSINEYGIYNLKKIYDSLNIPIYLDIFDKIKVIV
jgi:Ran GTPase-activating protein (RanGAP) involved in mRNA processing and transport